MTVLLIGSAAAPTGVRAIGGTIILVNTVSDNTTDDTVCSLREAIANANINAPTYDDCGAGSGDDLIVFDSALGTATITLGSVLPAISDPNPNGLTIDGGGDITISGNDQYRVFYVNSGVPLVLNNLTVAAGNPIGNGGGILNYGTLTITNSIFSANSAGVDGGGIYNSGTLNITNSTFSGNSAQFGGGINNTGTLTVTNSTFSGNSATNNGGGGIYNNSDLTVTNSTFSGNSATGNGGGIYNYSASVLTVTNSTFSGNTAGSAGGGVYNASTGTLNQYNVIIANSTGGDCVNNGTLTGNNNLIKSTGSDACGLTDGVGGNIIGSNPKFGPLAGSPAYFPLMPGSPAINTGDDAKCAVPPVNNISQNGLTRPQGAHCDIGSFELFMYTLFLPLILR